MLTHLHIENYALIRQSDIDLNDGFVAITGETGAGKSIMLGALGLLLGQRADTKVLFDPQRKCVVEAHFEVHVAGLKERCEEADVDYADDGQLIIRREILPSAKTRAFVNDTPVPLTFLRQLGSAIIDIHSQHATLLLGDSAFQTALLDSLGEGRTLLPAYRNAYADYTRLKRELEQLIADDQRNRKDYDYNKFLYDELEQARLNDGEQESLEQESRLLANAEGIKQALSQITALCDGEEDSALQRLAMCRTLLARTASCDKELEALHQRLDSTLIELRDIVATVGDINEGLTYSPERQQAVDERLDLIYRLEKKHGVDSVGALIALRDSLDAQLSTLDTTDQRIHEAMEAVDDAYKALQRAGEALTAARRAAAAKLGTEIAPLLADLGMKEATLLADVGRAKDYGPMGIDSVSLLFNANKGGEPRELSRVASGGELSRLMLAVKALTARAALLPTVIFDEIDAGISGDVSVKVGAIMRRMAQTMQVIAITHLPQIAARAGQHYKVYKENDGDRTSSNIRQLDNAGRQHEIAVMLSAEPPTAAAMQTAAELMEM